MNALERLFRAGRSYALVSEITRDPDPAPDHQYQSSPHSAAGNCVCGAAEHHRVHPHTFLPSDSEPSRCVCALPEAARCHAAPSAAEGCPTPGCDGDVRYAAPGRGHIAGCTYPRNIAAPEGSDA